MLEEFNIDEESLELVKKAESELKDIFNEVDNISNYNSLKVLSAFHRNHLSEVHLGSTTGYGYDDIGREKIERVFADVLGAEDAIVRNQFVMIGGC